MQLGRAYRPVFWPVFVAFDLVDGCFIYVLVQLTFLARNEWHPERLIIYIMCVCEWLLLLLVLLLLLLFVVVIVKLHFWILTTVGGGRLLGFAPICYSLSLSLSL